MEFNPNHPIIKRCVIGISLEEKGQHEEALQSFLQAWNEATHDFEKFISAFFVAKHQPALSDKITWYETARQHALNLNEVSVISTLPTLYTNMAKCYEDINDSEKAKSYQELSISSTQPVKDQGPFYHGTRANLNIGDMLTAGNLSNYKSELVMNHVYFTAMINGAGLAASLAKGDGPERVYMVEPTGSFENDPNVTDKKFPGNLTRSYRTLAPLRIIGEVEDWTKQTPEQIQSWKEKLNKNTGEIIN